MVSAEFYRQRENHFQIKADQLEKTIRQNSFARLVVAIVVLILIYLGFREPIYFSLAGSSWFPFFVFGAASTKKGKRKRDRRAE
jgi:hypothetical protein